MATTMAVDVDRENDRVHIHELTVHDETLVAFLEDSEAESAEETVERALKVGAATLQLAETAKEVEFVKREFTSMQEEVERELDDVHEELAETFGDEGRVSRILDGHLGEEGTLRRHIEDTFGDDGIFSERLDEELGENGERIQAALDPDVEGTPTYRLKQSLKEEIDGIRDKLVEEETEEVLRGKTPLKGEDFEETVEDMLTDWTYHTQHSYEYTGGTSGELSGRDVGDFVLELGDVDQRIVIEAKSDQSYTEPKIKEEMADAIENRNADYGIFLVESEAYVPDKVGYLQEYEEFVVVCLSQEHADDVDPRLFHIGLNWARMRAAQAGMETGEDLDPEIIQTKVEAAADAIDRFSSVKSKCTTIKKNANGIEATLDEIANEVKAQLADVEVELRKVEG